MKRYIDSCVLIAAVQGDDALAAAASRELDQEDCEFVFSTITVLEVMKSPLANNYSHQAAAFKEFFEASQQQLITLEVERLALEAMVNHSVHLQDAIHVACAKVAGADELLTAEKSTKPMFKVPGITVRSIRDPEGDPDQISAVRG